MEKSIRIISPTNEFMIIVKKRKTPVNFDEITEIVVNENLEIVDVTFKRTVSRSGSVMVTKAPSKKKRKIKNHDF